MGLDAGSLEAVTRLVNVRSAGSGRTGGILRLRARGPLGAATLAVLGGGSAQNHTRPEAGSHSAEVLSKYS